MALIADSGAIYALYDIRDRYHLPVKDVVDQELGPIILPMAILAEIDYLLRIRLGSRAVFRFLEGISIGVLTLEPLTPVDVKRCRSLLESYDDLDLGLADVAVIAAAERLQTHRILTVDERHFRAVRPSDGASFVLLPADA